MYKYLIIRFKEYIFIVLTATIFFLLTFSICKAEQNVFTIDNVEINNNDYVLGDIDGVVIIPQDNIEQILIKSEERINSENLVRKAIKEGMDPQEAYKKYSAF